MAEHAIVVKEILSRTIIVDAESSEEAVQEVRNAVEDGRITLEYDDYSDREIAPSEHFGNGTGKVEPGRDVSYYWHLD